MSENSSNENTFERLTPVLLVGVIILAFAVGILWQKVSNLEGGKVAKDTQTAEVGAPVGDGKLSEDQAANIPAVSDDDHIMGNKDAKVILIEYSDLECPYCSAFHTTAEQLLQEYGDDVAWVYRHFPLNFHPRALPAASAAECVAELGGNDAFWSFIGEVFADQEANLTDAGLKAVAINAGIDGDSYDSCFEADKYADKIDDQYQGGMTAGVTGTPGNFVVNQNGEVWAVTGAVPLENLKATVDEALQSL